MWISKETKRIVRVYIVYTRIVCSAQTLALLAEGGRRQMRAGTQCTFSLRLARARNESYAVFCTRRMYCIYVAATRRPLQPRAIIDGDFRSTAAVAATGCQSARLSD